MKPFKNPVVCYLLIASGTLSLVLGIIGIFLPLVPTTPFLLLSAFCYGRSSERWYHWLLKNPWFGEYIRKWQTTGTIPVRVKVFAILMLAISTSSSIFFFVSSVPVKVALASVSCAITIYLIRTPSKT